MQIIFTSEEMKYITVKDNDDYSLACMDDAPAKIKDSIMRNIEAHKRWLEDGGVK